MDTMDTHQKALQINLDPSNYGTFAEIGAGQEVARWFFRVGGASGTIAKTISAYDMVVSDAIYGACERYVSHQRLQTMLDREFDLLIERLSAQRGPDTRFFAFADTVAARSHSRPEGSHGWMGIKFQTEPGAEPSQVIMHIRLLDRDNLAQQEALGVIGVNLMFGALHVHGTPAALPVTLPTTLIDSLLDSLNRKRAEVDMIKFSGPVAAGIDNRLMNLHLVQKGLTKAAMIAAGGEVIQPAEVLYGKPILVLRGSFRPVTHSILNMLECAVAQFVQEPRVQGEPVAVVMEMTLNHLIDGDAIDHADFLARADILGKLGHTVLISNYGRFYQLAAYLFSFTKKMIGLAMGVPTLKEIFDEKYYADLPGGILESVGRMFEKDLKVYAYPYQDAATGSLITAGNLVVPSHLKHLYAYLYENEFIESIRGYDKQYLGIFSRCALAKLQTGDPTWEAMVPAPAADIIKERAIWGWRAVGAAEQE